MKADGGAAFPVLRTGPKYTERGTPYGEQIYSVGGMSLRDYFAGQALAGLLASYANPGANCAPTSDVAANESYAYADAMLAERERGE